MTPPTLESPSTRSAEPPVANSAEVQGLAWAREAREARVARKPIRRLELPISTTR